jgi:hypothetical protein
MSCSGYSLIQKKDVFLVIPGLGLEVFKISRLSFEIIQSFIAKTFKV